MPVGYDHGCRGFEPSGIENVPCREQRDGWETTKKKDIVCFTGRGVGRFIGF